MRHPGDERLAAHLEGLLEPAEAEALERELADDAAARARLEALRAVLAAPVELPSVPLPPGLAAAAAGRLADEGLAPATEDDPLAAPVALPAVEVPELLGEAVLDRLEAEGLVAPRAGDPLAEPVALPPVAAPEGLDGAVLDRLEAEDLVAPLVGDPLTPPVELPAAPPPGDLGERVHARLEGEGLLAPPPVPAGLLEATLGRLEEEGLVEAAPAAGGAAPAAELVRFPAPGRRLGGVAVWQLAAGLLLAVGLGLALGLAFGGGAGGPTVADRGAQVASLEDLVARLEDELDAARRAEADLDALYGEADAERRTLEVQRDEADLATEELGRRLDAARRRLEELAAERDALLVAEGRAEALAGQLARRDAELARARARAGEAEQLAAQVDALERTRREQAEAVADLEAESAEAHERVVELELAMADHRATVMQVAQASRADRWDPALGAWVPIAGAAELPAGAIVRGEGARGSLTVGGLRYDLRGGLYVVTAARRIEPIPDADRRTGSPRGGRVGTSLEARVPELIDLFARGSAATRARAHRALTALYRRHPDPGPDVADSVLSVAIATGGGGEAGGPPTTVQGWEAWWGRVWPTIH